MNRALWAKTIRDGRWLLLGSGLLLIVIHLIRVWITSQFEMGEIGKLLRFAPSFIKQFFPVPIEVMATPAGRIAIAYDDPLVVTIISIWAIARGSDAVSGEINRGTMEMLLAQPIRRIALLSTHALVTIIGLAVLAGCTWLGTFIGLVLIKLEEPVAASIFLFPASNVFALGVFLAGMTTMLSSWDRYRSRTIGIAVGIYVVQVLIKLISLAVTRYGWLQWCTVLTAFEPQMIAYRFWPTTLERSGAASWDMLIRNNGLLIVLGLVCYGVAAIVFCRRDLPAPL